MAMSSATPSLCSAGRSISMTTWRTARPPRRNGCTAMLARAGSSPTVRIKRADLTKAEFGAGVAPQPGAELAADFRSVENVAVAAAAALVATIRGQQQCVKVKHAVRDRGEPRDRCTARAVEGG